MRVSKIAVSLAFLNFAAVANAQTSPITSNWAGPYAGISFGSSHGGDRTLGTAATRDNTIVSSDGVCVNTSSGGVVSGTTTEADCGNNGASPFVWLRGTNNSQADGIGVGFASSSSSEAVKGLKVGYNWQREQVVYGIEADFNHFNRDTLNSSASAPTGNPLVVTASSRAGLERMLSVRGRVGYALSNRVMPYLTAGVAFGTISTETSVSYSDNGTVTSKSFGASENERKLIVGLGLDFKVTNNLVANLSYMRVNFGDRSATDQYVVGSSTGSVSTGVDASYRMVNLGLSWMFQ